MPVVMLCGEFNIEIQFGWGYFRSVKLDLSVWWTEFQHTIQKFIIVSSAHNRRVLCAAMHVRQLETCVEQAAKERREKILKSEVQAARSVAVECGARQERIVIRV